MRKQAKKCSGKKSREKFDLKRAKISSLIKNSCENSAIKRVFCCDIKFNDSSLL